MELIEISNAIEETKASYELSKTEKEAAYYKATLEELRDEKEKLLKELFKRNC